MMSSQSSAIASEEVYSKGDSRFLGFWKAFRKKKSALVSFYFILFLMAGKQQQQHKKIKEAMFVSICICTRIVNGK